MKNRRSVLAWFTPKSGAQFGPLPFATALRRSLAHGYDRRALGRDLLAGAVVGIVALPLSMALAIAVGVPPQHGLYTAIVAGFIVPLAGGSKHQVTGPTAAFVVILAPIVTRHGLSGLLLAGLMAGVLLIAMGLMRFGRLVQFIPHPVTTGFTAGMATVIATLQLKDAFALQMPHMPESYLEKLQALWGARATASVFDAATAAVTLTLLIGLPKLVPALTSRVPAPLLVLGVVSATSALLHAVVPTFSVATIGTKFQFEMDGELHAGIPALPPSFSLPWDSNTSFETLRDLASAAFAIAMLGAIESLLSAVIADGMTGKKHDPDAELVGLGLGNLIAPFFGGIAATGALARTATNVRAGGRSPIAGATHAVVVLLAVVLMAPLLAYVPMAALAALLLLVAWNMSEVRHALTILRIAPRDDVIVLVACYGLTVFFDMVVAVSVGVVAASLLFMRRTAELTKAQIFEPSSDDAERTVPPGVTLYEIAGPLFFGAAQNAMGAISRVGAQSRVVVLALGRVPSIDATGWVALDSALTALRAARKHVILAGPLPEPRTIFDRADLAEHHKNVSIVDSLSEALESAALLAEQFKALEQTGPASTRNPSVQPANKPSAAPR
jgi:sulfate permease, SulP family